MIVGHVESDSGKLAVPAASVTLTWQEVKADTSGVRTEPRVRRAISDSTGLYYICGVPANLSATLVAEKDSLRSRDIELQLGDNLFVTQNITVNRGNAVLSKTKVRILPAVTVKEKYTKGLLKVGFADRERQGLGKFISRDYIDKRSPTRFTDIFSAVHGVRAVLKGSVYDLVATRATAGSGIGKGCINYYVDGIKQPRVEPGDMDGAIKPENVAAIEIYHGPNTPQQFQSAGKSGCSTLVVWTTFKVVQEN